jgi:hypothetical protein
MPTTSEQTSTSSSPPTLSDAEFYAYVQTLPGVNGVTADNIDEFAGLLCRALRSPKMSPAYFDELVGLEVSGYNLSESEAINLLLQASYNQCPEMSSTVTARGSAAG